MPVRPRSGCTVPGCPELVDRPGRCRRHRREADREAKARQRPYREGVYKGDWPAVRARVLAEEPACRTCGAPSTVADHIIPVSRGGARRDRANLQALCDDCHRRKTAAEQGLGGAH